MMTARELKTITSLKIRKYRKLYRKFLIEGPHLAEECLNSGYRPEHIILREDFKFSSHPPLSKLINRTDVNVSIISSEKFKKISDTENSQGIVCVLPFLESQKKVRGDLVIGLDSVSDPGNLGTILRTAYWFGVRDVLIGKGSADIYNPKVLRASQGAVFYLNLINEIELKSFLTEQLPSVYSVFLLDTASFMNIDEIIKPEKSVLIVGNEAQGIAPELKNAGFQKIKIRGFSACQSLNAAISASIALYEFRRGN